MRLFTSKLLFVCSYLTLNATLTAESNPQQIADSQLKAAALQKAGDWSGALSEYESIIQSCPNTPSGLEACSRAAQIYVESGQYDQLRQVASKICTDYIEQPGSFRTLSESVKQCMYAKAYPEAESVCIEVQRQLSLHPRAALASGWLGMVYAQQNKSAQAGEIKRQLLSSTSCIASDLLDAMCDIGWGYYCAGNLDEALLTYRQGLDRQPNHKGAVYLQYNIVKTYLTKNDIASAQAAMNTLLTKYAHRANTLGLACRLAGEYRQKGYSDQAITLYKQMQVQFADHQQICSVWDALVETYADKGQLETAAAILRADIEKYPGRRELLRMITRVSVEKARVGDTGTASEFAEELFKQNPAGEDQLFAYTTRARVYVHEGKDAAAAALVDEMIDQFSEKPDALAYHLFGVGEEYYLAAESAFQNGNLELANIDYAKAIAFWEKNINRIASLRQCQTYYYTAISYAKLGQVEKALQYYQAAAHQTNLSQGQCHALYEYALAFDELIHRGQIPEVQGQVHMRDALQQLLNKYPASTEAQAAQHWFNEREGK